MPHPNVRFKINKKEDIDVALAFRNMRAGGVDFRTCGLLSPHPDLRTHARLTRRVLASYVDRFYLEHADDLERTRKKFEIIWRETADMFFSLSADLFGSGFPPQKTYSCFISIWNCNPRDIRRGSFMVYRKHVHPREVMVHEMLHFAFYAYVFSRYPRTRRTPYDQTLWKLSEAFNTVILNSTLWRKRLRLKRQPPYPQLYCFAQTMHKQWMKHQDINRLLDKYLEKK